MPIRVSLLPEHIEFDDVRLTEKGILQCAISVTREERGQEEIGYSRSKEVQVESALAHQHHPTIFELDSAGQDVDSVLREANAQFQRGTPLRQEYTGAPWYKHTHQGVDWEGQSSILVGRCSGVVVGIVCLRIHFVSVPESPEVRFLNVGIGPFFVPPKRRGCAHAIEMSIAASHLCSVMLQALYHQMPMFGRMGVLVSCDFTKGQGAEELHPFALQIHQKLVVTQEILGLGFISGDTKYRTISFYPPRLER